MIIVETHEAYLMLGHDKYSSDIKFMSQQTYNLWFDTYYKLQLDKYPNWEILYDIYMNLTLDKSTYKYKGFVAIESNQIVGYCGMSCDTSCDDFIVNSTTNSTTNSTIHSQNNYTLWLSDVYVWEEYRRKGISKQLIEKVKNVAREMNEEIFLECEDDLIKFYSNQGWSLVNTSKLYNYWNIMKFKLN